MTRFTLINAYNTKFKVTDSSYEILTFYVEPRNSFSIMIFSNKDELSPNNDALHKAASLHFHQIPNDEPHGLSIQLQQSSSKIFSNNFHNNKKTPIEIQVKNLTFFSFFFSCRILVRHQFTDTPKIIVKFFCFRYIQAGNGCVRTTSFP